MIKGFRFVIDGVDYSRNIDSGMQTLLAKSAYGVLCEKLGTLMDDIEVENGILELDKSTGKVLLSGCSEDLVDKVTQALL